MITDTQLRKLVLWVAKIATLIISAPATIEVIGRAYEGKSTHFFVVVLVQIAGLLVVEGAFLYFWQLVEDTRSLQTKEEREQNTYVAAAWAMYFLLLVVGFIHGEGAVTLILRFAMGLLLYVATNDKLSAMRKKYEEERIKGKRKTRKERREEAKAEEVVSLALIEARKKQQIAAIKAKADLLEQVSQELIVRRILLSLPAGNEVIEGEVVEEILPDNQLVGLPEEKLEQTSKKVISMEEAIQLADKVAAEIQESLKQPVEEIKETEVTLLDNGSYTVVKKGDDFVVACKFCDYKDVKLGSASNNAYTSAVRAGSKHMGKHKVKESEEQKPADMLGF